MKFFRWLKDKRLERFARELRRHSQSLMADDNGFVLNRSDVAALGEKIAAELMRCLSLCAAGAGLGKLTMETLGG